MLTIEQRRKTDRKQRERWHQRKLAKGIPIASFKNREQPIISATNEKQNSDTSKTKPCSKSSDPNQSVFHAQKEKQRCDTARFVKASDKDFQQV